MFIRAARFDVETLRQVASWDPSALRRVLPAVGAGAEHTRMWWIAAAVMAATGGPTGRGAAARGPAAMGVAELLSNAVVKPLFMRRRPPSALLPHEDVEDRPDSSSFPSGHAAAAVGFTAAVAQRAPRWGAAVAVPAVLVGVERVHSGAHYPSDVAAGALIGLACAQLLRRIPAPRAPRRRHASR